MLNSTTEVLGFGFLDVHVVVVESKLCVSPVLALCVLCRPVDVRENAEPQSSIFKEERDE